MQVIQPHIKLGQILQDITVKGAQLSRIFAAILKCKAQAIYLSKIKRRDNKYIVLVDPCIGGHHVTYLQLLAEVLFEASYHPIILNDSSEEIYNYLIAKKFLPNSFTVHKLNHVKRHCSENSPIAIGNVFYNWLDLLNTIFTFSKKYKIVPSLVFFSWLDSYLHDKLRPVYIDFFLKFPWTGLYFHPRHLRMENPIKRHSLYAIELLLLSKYCKSIAVLDEGISQIMAEKIYKSVYVFPDIAADDVPDTNFDLYEDIAQKIRNRKVISLLGSLEKRKGIMTFIEMIERNTSDYFFIMVGNLYKNDFTKDELTRIEKIGKEYKNVYFYTDGFLPTEAQLNAIIQLSDVLFLGYINFFHSSNFMTKAALFDKPIIVTEGSLMAERTIRYNLGEIIEANDYKGGLAAIESLFSRGEYRYGFSEFLKDHSKIKLATRFKQLLENSLQCAE